MSTTHTTNKPGVTIKAFAKLKKGYRTARGHELHAGDVLETSYAHYGLMTCLSLQAPNGESVIFAGSEMEVTVDEMELGGAAFACLVCTLRGLLDDLAGSMDDIERARMGRHLMGQLVRGTPDTAGFTVHTIRDLTVGQLLDLITDAKAACIVV